MPLCLPEQLPFNVQYRSCFAERQYHKKLARPQIYLSRKDVEDLNITMKEVLVAVDDMVTAKVLYERAIKTGAGVRLPL